MGQCEGLAGTLLVKNVSAVSAVVFSVGKRESCATAHADIRVNPLRWSIAVKHAACHVLLRRKVVAFSLQRLVHLRNIDEVYAAFRGTSPGLYEF